MTKALDPSRVAARLLAAVEARYARTGLVLPERRYLLAGNAAGAAWDDAHVSVSLNSLQPGTTPGAELTDGPSSHQGRTVMLRGIYEIRILRCWPALGEDGEAPDAEEITAASEEAMRDAGEILQSVYEFAEADRSNATMKIGEVQPLGPLGALAGYSIVVTISPPV